ncbi:MAG: ATP-binding protein [Spirochaetales bacterium]|nr:ATP-binding protein [Spirochaetales bacterium]
MQNEIISRHITDEIKRRLGNNPAVALLGARQVGKSTLAREILKERSDALFLDLEKSSDRMKIESDPEIFLKMNRDKLICLDEVQRLPEIFSTLRSFIDENDRSGQLLILGSASRDLIRQSSESLAGRIAYMEISPFLIPEINGRFSEYDLWLKGGYPRSILQKDPEESMDWRRDYIRTFLERDIPQLGFSIPSKNMERLWTMLAHNHGQLINFSNLGKSLGVSHHTVKSYIDILEQTFVVRSLSPFYSNLGKRLIKTPKLYIRDTGILHTLLGIEEMNDLLGHPVCGNSYESYVIENIRSLYPHWQYSFYRDSTGNEIDLIMEKGNRRIAIEIKSSGTPKPEKGFWNSLDFVKPTETWILAPVDETYPGPKGVKISNPLSFIQSL